MTKTAPPQTSEFPEYPLLHDLLDIENALRGCCWPQAKEKAEEALNRIRERLNVEVI